MDHAQRPTAEIVTVTPQLARAWLEKNTSNRPPRKAGIARYADMMKRGAWELAPDAIAFDAEGKVANGQNRLMAVVQANTPQDFVVVRGLNPDGFPFWDGGFRRSLSDHLDMSGYKNTTLLASIARVIANIARAGVASRALVSTSNSGDRLENDELINFIDQYADELDAAVRVGRLGNRSKVLPATIAGITYALYSPEHDIEPFLMQVIDGVGIKGRRSPAYLLRKRLEPEYTNTARVLRPPRFEAVAYTFLAANLHVNNQERTVLKWVPTKQSPYPQPDVDLSFWRERMPAWTEAQDEE